MVRMGEPAGPRDAWPDAALVEGARRGDPACFEALVRRHQRRARAVAQSVCGDAAESQDIAQEAFVRAWTNLDLLVDPGRFAAWLSRIAFACAIDGLRGRPALHDGPLEDLPSPAPPADEALGDRQMAAAVGAALARLPPRYRRPLVLYHLDGLRQERIAAVLGVAPGTVRSLVTRARQALRADLAPPFPGEPAMSADDLLSDPTARAMLHVCNGRATSAPLQQAGVPGQYKLFCDPLLEGPCPPLWDEPWRELRLRFLTGGGYAGPEAPRAGEELWDTDVARALAEPLDEIVLWYEHDLYDQLLLVRLFALVARHRGPRPPLSLVCIGEHPAVPSFKGLGQLTPHQLASLFETRGPVDDGAIALGRDAWEAYTDPDPRALERFLGRDLSRLPFLGRALHRHLEEYPGVHDGLSRTERTLLTLVQDGESDPLRVWQRLHTTEDCLYVTDVSHARLLERLSAAPAPLLVVGEGHLSLTPLGQEVLGGHRDWLPLAALDRWLGGVHLTDPSSAWRWDPGAARLRRPHQV
jgi:RNA polymerase sigma factor (sigma-70 family)